MYVKLEPLGHQSWIYSPQVVDIARVGSPSRKNVKVNDQLKQNARYIHRIIPVLTAVAAVRNIVATKIM